MPVLMFGSWVLNEIWIIHFSSALVGILISSSKYIISFFVRSSFKLRCETVIGIALFHSHQTCCAKLTMTFTFTIELLHFELFPRVVVVSDLSKNIIGGSTYGFGKTRARISGFAYSYSPSLI